VRQKFDEQVDRLRAMIQAEGKCVKTNEQLGAALGVSRAQAALYLRALKDRGLVNIATSRCFIGYGWVVKRTIVSLEE
jgi:DNA-binding transcriptional regulator LsrR (DeoR family)